MFFFLLFSLLTKFLTAHDPHIESQEIVQSNILTKIHDWMENAHVVFQQSPGIGASMSMAYIYFCSCNLTSFLSGCISLIKMLKCDFNVAVITPASSYLFIDLLSLHQISLLSGCVQFF